MADRFEINIQGLTEVEDALNKLVGALNLSAIVDESSAVLLNRLRTRFLAQTTPDGVAWTPSKASLTRAANGRGGGTLYDTGRLFHSLQLSAIGANERAIGTDVPYAPYNDATRKFLGFADDDVSVAQEVVLRRVREAFA